MCPHLRIVQYLFHGKLTVTFLPGIPDDVVIEFYTSGSGINNITSIDNTVLKCGDQHRQLNVEPGSVLSPIA